MYSLEIVTVAGSADSAFLDRLAEVAYAIPQLANLHMGLNADGGLSAFFDGDAEGPLEAADAGVRHFTEALAAAVPIDVSASRAIARFGVSMISLPDLASA